MPLHVVPSQADPAGPQFQLLREWSGGDPAGWVMSEKLDGIRAWWDPSRGTLWTRGGVDLRPPEWFLQGFPTDRALDGELYAGPGQFSATQRLVRGQDQAAWSRVQFMVFDSPTWRGPIESRIVGAMAGCYSAPRASPVLHRTCRSGADMRATLARVVAKGGEGLVLRAPGSLYLPGERSPEWIKLKPYYLPNNNVQLPVLAWAQGVIDG